MADPSLVKLFALTMSEVVQSGRSCVLIDDSGTPGQIAGSEYLSPDRKTWVAVLLPSRQVTEVFEQMPGCLQELREKTGATEFHFMDIYRGSGQFRLVALDIRLAIFAFMRYIFASYNFPVLVQTFDQSDLRELRTRAVFPNRVGPFDMSKTSDTALLFLLIRVKWFLQQNENEFTIPSYFVLDEGFRQADRAIEIPKWDAILNKSSIFSTKSSSFLPIQLADFAAFCIARSQWLLNKENRSYSDDAFLKIIAGNCLNIVNLPISIIDTNNWTPQDYGRLIESDRKLKGLSPKHNPYTK